MSKESPQAAPARRFAVLALKLVVSVALLTLLFWRVDTQRLWAMARRASLAWLAIALAVYLINVLASVWRWWRLLEAQDVDMAPPSVLASYLVALYFNNFLPSNIGGDVIRIRDSAKVARSKTLATTVVLLDRVLGLIGLVLVAATGATMAASAGGRVFAPMLPTWLWGGFILGAMAAAPAILAPAGVGRLLQPLTVLHPEWVGDRIETLTGALERFRDRPAAVISCFGGAVFVQAVTVLFYVAVAYALHVEIAPWSLAVIVPLSFVVQMLPVSVNGFGVREATFSLYFSRLGLPIESAILLSLGATVLVMLFSLSGAAVYVARGHH